MCGIAAYSGKSVNILKAMHLLEGNDERGGHSTGIYVENGEFKKLYKTTGKSKNLLRIIEHNKVDLFIGHTRFATHGVKTAENTHPYVIGKYIGCHNGVLSNYEELCKSHKVDTPDVDSKAIYEILNSGDQDLEVYQSLGMHGGTINAVWTEQDGRLYVYRRNNPLFKLELANGIYFSSIKESLEEIRPNGYHVTEQEKETLDIYEKGCLINSIYVPTTYVQPKETTIRNWTDYREEEKTEEIQDYDWTTKYTERYSFEMYEDKHLESKEIKLVMTQIEICESLTKEMEHYLNYEELESFDALIVSKYRELEALQDQEKLNIQLANNQLTAPF